MRTILMLAGLLAAGCTQPHEAYDASGMRLKVRRLTGDDGSTTTLGFQDTELKTPCAFEPSPEGYRCLPTGTARVRFFSESSCTLFAADAPNDASPRFGRSGFAFFELEPLSNKPADLFSRSNTGCDRFTPELDVTYFGVGKKLPLGSFVLGTETLDP